MLCAVIFSSSVKISFWYLLVVLFISLSNVSNLFKKGHFPFSAFFGGHVCYHGDRTSQINTRLFNLVYCSNKLIRGN